MPVNIKTNVKVDLTSLKEFRQQVDDQLHHRTTGPITKALKQWGARYRSYIKERFDTYSKGGGDWPPLADSTKERRRKPSGKSKKPLRKNFKNQKAFVKAKVKYLKKRKFAILRDTGTLYAVLSPTFSNKPGQFEVGIPNGIRVGYGGNSRHPKGKASIADIASFHQTGAGFLPVRKIIVTPPNAVTALMASDMVRALKQLSNDNDNAIQ